MSAAAANPWISPRTGPYFIAEAGVNHNGDPELAIRLVEAAAAAGADAVKFQAFSAAALVTDDCPKAEYQVANDGREESQRAMLERLELDAAAFARLKSACERHGVDFLCSAFDEESVDLLVRLAVKGIKFGSGELTNLPLIRHAAASGPPLILSTGMASMEEVQQAYTAASRQGVPRPALLQCTSQYPTPYEHCNLRAMGALRDAFPTTVGFSDHSEGWHVTTAATALGAEILEKHFTLDRALPGPDHAASLEPAELRTCVRQCREIAAALGDARKHRSPVEEDTARVARKSLVLCRDLSAGTELTAADLAARRPGTGISPARMEDFIGRRLRRAVPAGTMLAWELIE